MDVGKPGSYLTGRYSFRIAGHTANYGSGGFTAKWPTPETR